MLRTLFHGWRHPGAMSLCAAVSVMLLAHFVRGLLPALHFGVRLMIQESNTREATASTLLFLVLLPFILALPVPVLMTRYRVSSRRAVAFFGATQLVMRLVQQIAGDVVVELVACLMGMFASTLLLPLLLEIAKKKRALMIQRFTFGLAIGVVLDSLLRGLLDSHDLFQPGSAYLTAANTLLVVLLLAHTWALWRIRWPAVSLAPEPPSSTDTHELNVWSTAQSLAVGFYLYIQLAYFQNSGQVSTIVAILDSYQLQALMIGSNILAILAMPVAIKAIEFLQPDYVTDSSYAILNTSSIPQPQFFSLTCWWPVLPGLLFLLTVLFNNTSPVVALVSLPLANVMSSFMLVVALCGSRESWPRSPRPGDSEGRYVMKLDSLPKWRQRKSSSVAAKGRGGKRRVSQMPKDKKGKRKQTQEEAEAGGAGDSSSSSLADMEIDFGIYSRVVGDEARLIHFSGTQQYRRLGMVLSMLMWTVGCALGSVFVYLHMRSGELVGTLLALAALLLTACSLWSTYTCNLLPEPTTEHTDELMQRNEAEQATRVQDEKRSWVAWQPLLLILLLLLVVLVVMLALGASLSVVPSGPSTPSLPMTVATYNINHGRDARGRSVLDQSLASVAALQVQADVLALQGVSRGWLMDGGVDQLMVAHQQLHRRYPHAAAVQVANSQHVHVVYSRYPLRNVQFQDLPSGIQGVVPHHSLVAAEIGLRNRTVVTCHNDTVSPVTCNVTEAAARTQDTAYPDYNVTFGTTEDVVKLITTALYAEDARVLDVNATERVAQIDALLAQWKGHAFALFAGDFGAPAPNSDEHTRMLDQRFFAPRLQDTFITGNPQGNQTAWQRNNKGLTYVPPSPDATNEPTQRHDWIFVGPEWTPLDTAVLDARGASTHLPYRCALNVTWGYEVMLSA